VQIRTISNMTRPLRKRSYSKAFGSSILTCAATVALTITSLHQVVSSQSIPPLHMRTHSTTLSQRASENGSIVIAVVNHCAEQICPGFNTQAGQGPPSTGFCLQSGENQSLSVSSNWQGRVWGRTNCSFPNHGAPNAACQTGDCAGALACTQAV
jgi:Thaumatin family